MERGLETRANDVGNLGQTLHKKPSTRTSTEVEVEELVPSQQLYRSRNLLLFLSGKHKCSLSSNVTQHLVSCTEGFFVICLTLPVNCQICGSERDKTKMKQ